MIGNREPGFRRSHKQREFSDCCTGGAQDDNCARREKAAPSEADQRHVLRKVTLTGHSVCLKCNGKRFRKLRGNLVIKTQKKIGEQSFTRKKRQSQHTQRLGCKMPSQNNTNRNSQF